MAAHLNLPAPIVDKLDILDFDLYADAIDAMQDRG